ncbi:MAG: hypothetical protein FRX48_03863 [Lasallia pustulata]|uniref:Uncharacterized protein n=1 Tax=Lasallia pustulata TaxID=136370 RepID=A0A5M8PTK8_9LECA|nr:MAG: hypothetical protein FRX48_03863 [Lasallia pustulata]
MSLVLNPAGTGRKRPTRMEAIGSKGLDKPEHYWVKLDPIADFLYPPLSQGGIPYTFNYLDTVNVSWDTYVKYPVATSHYYLSLSYENNTYQVNLLHNWTVSAIGSQLISLDPFQTVYPCNFIWQGPSIGINYTTISFYITRNSQQAPVLWGAYNGTGPLQSYIFTTTTSPSS